MWRCGTEGHGQWAQWGGLDCLILGVFSNLNGSVTFTEHIVCDVPQGFAGKQQLIWSLDKGVVLIQPALREGNGPAHGILCAGVLRCVCTEGGEGGRELENQ